LAVYHLLGAAFSNDNITGNKLLLAVDQVEAARYP
jgi:hypothetical protein